MNALVPDASARYLAEFGRVGGLLPGQGLPWLREAREAAMTRFARTGFPNQREEDWKYTSVAPIEKAEFTLVPSPCHDFLAPQVSARALPGAHLLVFVNGRLETRLCRARVLPPGVILSGLGYMLDQNPGRLEKTLVVSDIDSPFADLNLAFMSDGAYVRLPPGAVVKAPIHLLFIATEANLAIQPRNLILAASGSSACIVEHHVAMGEPSYFTNAVTDIVVAGGARIEHHKVQEESPNAFHIATVNVTQGAKSNFVSGSFALGGRLTRVGITVGLEGEGSVCELLGLYLADKRQHVDHHTCIDHLKAQGTSREFYKGVLSEAAHAVFNGRVVVHPDAQGSDAFQSNRNLLLSENAEIDTKPQLEIWADDVKCSHGATVGDLDEDQVFYLRSRGIDDASARALLTRAFALEVIERVRLLPLQERLDELLQEKLPLH